MQGALPGKRHSKVIEYGIERDPEYFLFCFRKV